jgi:hypothetical protein
MGGQLEKIPEEEGGRERDEPLVTTPSAAGDDAAPEPDETEAPLQVPLSCAADRAAFCAQLRDRSFALVRFSEVSPPRPRARTCAAARGAPPS